LNSSGLYTERMLLEQIAGGDHDAFRKLYMQYKDHVYGFALGVTRLVPVAEEIVQETFAKVWLKREALPGIEKFEGWLFTIARNLCYTALRKSALEIKMRIAHELSLPDHTVSVEEIVIAKENDALIRHAIRQLPAQQRRVYLLSREQGLTYEEIACELNISRNTVKEHLRRAAAAIRAYLEIRLATTIVLLMALSATTL